MKKYKNFKLSGLDLEEFRQLKHSWSFVAISSKDPEMLATKIRQACERTHVDNPQCRFNLYDSKINKLIHYGLGTSANDYRVECNLGKAQDEMTKNALKILNEPDNKNLIWAIKKHYDYAWIYKAIKSDLISGFNYFSIFSAKSFISYVKSLGFSNIAEKRTINKYAAQVKDGRYFPWTFDRDAVDIPEENRRNAIVRKFIELMQE